MDIKTSADLLITALSEFKPALKIASTGSCYIELSGANVKVIRVANHTGHINKKNWQLRSDVCSSMKKGFIIFNCVHRLISKVKAKQSAHKGIK